MPVDQTLLTMFDALVLHKDEVTMSDEALAKMQNDGGIRITYTISDKFDLSAGSDRGGFYNFIGNTARTARTMC